MVCSAVNPCWCHFRRKWKPPPPQPNPHRGLIVGGEGGGGVSCAIDQKRGSPGGLCGRLCSPSARRAVADMRPASVRALVKRACLKLWTVVQQVWGLCGSILHTPLQSSLSCYHCIPVTHLLSYPMPVECRVSCAKDCESTFPGQKAFLSSQRRRPFPDRCSVCYVSF